MGVPFSSGKTQTNINILNILLTKKIPKYGNCKEIANLRTYKKLNLEDKLFKIFLPVVDVL